MTVVTGPTQINPSHHVKLTDGTDTVGLILVDGYGKPSVNGFQINAIGSPIKMYSGEAKDDDSAPPLSPQIMNDFSGGMGARIFDEDKSRYYWGIRAYTSDGKYMIGPEHVYTGGLYRNWPYQNFHYVWHEMNAVYKKLGVKFTATSAANIRRIHIVAKGDVYYLNVSILNDDAGLPGTVVGAGGWLVQTDNDECVINVNTGALTIGNDYWLMIDGNLTGSLKAYILCSSEIYVTGVKKYAFPGGAWSDITTYRPFYYTFSTAYKKKLHFFEYKGALYAANQYDNGTTTTMWLVGDQGVVKTGSTATDVTSDSGVATWAADEAIGCVFVITAGKGSTQSRNFRIIEDNVATSSTETLFKFTNDPWEIAPDETSEYAIVASNKLTLITPDITGSNPWTNISVTDVLSVNQAVYFAHGDDNDMTRMRAYVDTNVWKYEWSVEADNSEATYLDACTDPEGSFIWKAKGGYPAKVAKAPVVDCSGTAAADDLVWEDEIGIGDMGSRITNLTVYGDDYSQMHVMKEDGIYKISLASDDTDYVSRIAISSFPNTKDWRNGRAVCVHDTYLYFGWHDTVMRYYRNYLDNIGPNSQDVNIPDKYRGVISALVSYPGTLYASIDAGEDGYSTVIAYNGTGWCNVYTAPEAGMRIQNIYIQSIPGDNVDRLWISMHDNPVWIPISVNPIEFPEISYNQYMMAWSATLYMGRMFAGRRVLNKYWDEMSFNIFEAFYGATAVYYPNKRIKITLKDIGLIEDSLDGLETEWDSSASTSYGIDISQSSYRIMPSIKLEQYDPEVYTAIEALNFKCVVMEEYGESITLTCRIQDDEKDLNGNYDDILDHDDKLDQLTAWAKTTPTVLTMTSVAKQLDGKEVFLTKSGIRLISIERDSMDQSYIVQLVLYVLGE